MSNLSYLIEIGEGIVQKYEQDIARDSALSDWRKECIVLCNELLYELRQDNIKKEKLMDMVVSIKKKYLKSKPPVMPFWCRKIEEYFGMV